MCQRTGETGLIYGHGFPLLCYFNLSAAFKLNKTSMAPPQNMVISPLLETWKKEGVSFKSQTRSTIQHPHCHLSLKEVSSKSSGWMADGLPYWVAWVMLGCLDAANHGWGFSNSGTEKFNFIINSLIDSVALRKRGFTAIRTHLLLIKGRHGR